MRGVGEVIEQRVKVGVEIRERAERREGLGHPHPPPFALEPAKLTCRVTRSEGEPRRVAESQAKPRRYGSFRRVHAELTSEARVGAADRLPRFEQGTGSVEECGANHFFQCSAAMPTIQPNRRLR